MTPKSPGFDEIWSAGPGGPGSTLTSSVIGTPPVGPPVADTDPSHYFGLPPPEDVPTLTLFGLFALALLLLGMAQVQMRRS